MLLYETAANIIDDVQKKKSTIKYLVLGCKFQQKKLLYALVCETLKYRHVLEQILDATKLLKLEKKLAAKSRSFSLLLLYDFLFGKGLQTAPKWKACIVDHKAALNAELARIKIKTGAIKNEDLLPMSSHSVKDMPRYVRINTLKTNVEMVIEKFKSEGYTLVKDLSEDHSSFTASLHDLKPRHFLRDLHVPELLVFAPRTDLHDHPLYESGEIILQDKASCFPSYILSPPPGSHVIDCCAAPGNKTSHMAAIMKNQGKIFAFDLDSHRLSTMKKLCSKAGVTNTELIHQDFLTVDPTDSQYSQVEYILVDPSCSGSGIASRLNNLTDDEQSQSKSRLESLAKFQVSILKHALTFPKVKKVTYSTCSIHREENEDVVQEVLDSVRGKFHLETILKTWSHRGEGGDLGKSCVRASPDKDLTNGFFVACFTLMDGNDPSVSVPPVSESLVGTTAEPERKMVKKRRRRKKKSEIGVSGSPIFKSGDDGSPNFKSGDADSSALGSKNISEETRNLENKEGDEVPGKKKRRRKRKRKSSVLVDENDKEGCSLDSNVTEGAAASVNEGDVVSAKKKRRKRRRKLSADLKNDSTLADSVSDEVLMSETVQKGEVSGMKKVSDEVLTSEIVKEGEVSSGTEKVSDELQTSETVKEGEVSSGTKKLSDELQMSETVKKGEVSGTKKVSDELQTSETINIIGKKKRKRKRKRKSSTVLEMNDSTLVDSETEVSDEVLTSETVKEGEVSGTKKVSEEVQTSETVNVSGTKKRKRKRKRKSSAVLEMNDSTLVDSETKVSDEVLTSETVKEGEVSGTKKVSDELQASETVTAGEVGGKKKRKRKRKRKPSADLEMNDSTLVDSETKVSDEVLTSETVTAGEVGGKKKRKRKRKRKPSADLEVNDSTLVDSETKVSDEVLTSETVKEEEVGGKKKRKRRHKRKLSALPEEKIKDCTADSETKVSEETKSSETESDVHVGQTGKKKRKRKRKSKPSAALEESKPSAALEESKPSAALEESKLSAALEEKTKDNTVVDSETKVSEKTKTSDILNEGDVTGKRKRRKRQRESSVLVESEKDLDGEILTWGVRFERFRSLCKRGRTENAEETETKDKKETRNFGGWSSSAVD